MRVAFLLLVVALGARAGIAHAEEEEGPRRKTPGLRDLGHSDPYLHTGTGDTLEAVVRFHVEASALVRAGGLRNGARELRRMTIGEVDVAPLVAFLRALDEDYE